MSAPPNLTILSVKYGSSQLLRANIALTKRLNPASAYSWIVVNNDLEPGFASDGALRVIPGAERQARADKGSAHHAAGLTIGLSEVQTRYVLLLDHDFFVIRPHWIARVLQYANAEHLGFFGSVWHPRWSYQYRDFPSVHFMLIDLAQVAINELDFAPGIDEPGWDRVVSQPHLPLPSALRQLLQVGRLRDTGFRVQRRFKAGQVAFECLQPHFDLEAALADAPSLHRLAHRFLPQWLSVWPKNPRAYTARSFLRESAPLAYERGWEEFFWRDEPFAVHLRSVGRAPQQPDWEFAQLTRLLEHVDPGVTADCLECLAQ